MVRSYVSTLRGKIEALYHVCHAYFSGITDWLFTLCQPYHVDFFAEDRSEFTPSLVDDKVRTTSGSKSKVTSQKGAARLR